jgi:hypothetical protein
MLLSRASSWTRSSSARPATCAARPTLPGTTSKPASRAREQFRDRLGAGVVTAGRAFVSVYGMQEARGSNPPQLHHTSTA